MIVLATVHVHVQSCMSNYMYCGWISTGYETLQSTALFCIGVSEQLFVQLKELCHDIHVHVRASLGTLSTNSNEVWRDACASATELLIGIVTTCCSAALLQTIESVTEKLYSRNFTGANTEQKILQDKILPMTAWWEGGEDENLLQTNISSFYYT